MASLQRDQQAQLLSNKDIRKELALLVTRKQQPPEHYRKDLLGSYRVTGAAYERRLFWLVQFIEDNPTIGDMNFRKFFEALNAISQKNYTSAKKSLQAVRRSMRLNEDQAHALGLNMLVDEVNLLLGITKKNHPKSVCDSMYLLDRLIDNETIPIICNDTMVDDVILEWFNQSINNINLINNNDDYVYAAKAILYMIKLSDKSIKISEYNNLLNNKLIEIFEYLNKSLISKDKEVGQLKILIDNYEKDIDISNGLKFNIEDEYNKKINEYENKINNAEQLIKDFNRDNQVLRDIALKLLDIMMDFVDSDYSEFKQSIIDNKINSKYIDDILKISESLNKKNNLIDEQYKLELEQQLKEKDEFIEQLYDEINQKKAVINNAILLGTPENASIHLYKDIPFWVTLGLSLTLASLAMTLNTDLPEVAVFYVFIPVVIVHTCCVILFREIRKFDFNHTKILYRIGNGFVLSVICACIILLEYFIHDRLLIQHEYIYITLIFSLIGFMTGLVINKVQYE